MRKRNGVRISAAPDGVFRAVQHRRRDQQRLHPYRPALRRGRLLEDTRYRHPLRTGFIATRHRPAVSWAQCSGTTTSRKWMRNLREVEDMDFAYTDISLNRTYEMSFCQALEVIRRNGGSVGETDVTVACQQPVPVRFEQSFERALSDRTPFDTQIASRSRRNRIRRHRAVTGALRCPRRIVRRRSNLLDRRTTGRTGQAPGALPHPPP